jgi:transcriptional regulator with XRE-family HTH domain
MSVSIGARLREARELRRLTLQQVSETTKVRTHYLQALESDDFSAIPSAAQARGFLRIYAEFLELDLGEMLPEVQPEPAATSADVSVAATPVDAKPMAAAPQLSRPSLWASLRGRLARRSTGDAEMVSSPTELAPIPPISAELPDAGAPLPASTEAQTTRRTKTAAADVKKKVGR